MRDRSQKTEILLFEINIFYLHITFIIPWERLEPGQLFLCLPFPQVGTTCPFNTKYTKHPSF